MPITDFETPESFRGRFEWTVEDEAGDSCSNMMSSLTRRVHVRRQTAYRWCKLATALILAVLFTQTIFYITGKSVIPYNPSQPIPGSVLLDNYQHTYLDDTPLDSPHMENEDTDLNDNLYSDVLREASVGDEAIVDGDLSFMGMDQDRSQEEEMMGNEGAEQTPPPLLDVQPDDVAPLVGYEPVDSPQIPADNLQPESEIPFVQQQIQQPLFPEQPPVFSQSQQGQQFPGQQSPFQMQQPPPQQYPGQVPFVQVPQAQLPQYGIQPQYQGAPAPQQPLQPQTVFQGNQFPQQPLAIPQVPYQDQQVPQQPGAIALAPYQSVIQPNQAQQPQDIAGQPPFPNIQFGQVGPANPPVVNVPQTAPSRSDDTLGALEKSNIPSIFPDEQNLAAQQIEQPAGLPGLHPGPQQSNFPSMSGGFVGVSGSIGQQQQPLQQQSPIADVAIGQVGSSVYQHQPDELLPDNTDQVQQDGQKLLHDIGMERAVSQVAPTPVPIHYDIQQLQPNLAQQPPVQDVITTGQQINPPLDDGPDFLYGQFPNGFFWSVATSAYQIEGAWNEDGKGPSNWDVFSHTPGRIEDGTTGDIACDSYHKYQEDVMMAKSLGVKHYRFSLSWSRIQPTGLDATVNPKGVEYYNNLINALIAEGIQPAITLYHWDLPQALEEQGGWLNSSLIVNAFANYARHCYREFGDRVKFWITLNEPFITANAGYGRGKKAPGLTGEGDLVYIAGHNLLKAHAHAYRLYQREFQSTQKGFVGITLNIVNKEPLHPDNPLDVQAAERAMQFDLGWFANPIYGDGDYPEVMKKQVALKSQQQGLTTSRLPEFTESEKKFIKGTSDFFGLNTYTTRLIEHFVQPYQKPGFSKDQDVREVVDPNWPKSGSPWLMVYPPGIRNLLNWIKNHYGMVPIYITESGISDRNGTLDDYHRIYYYKFYINNILKAVNLDGVRVIGYTAWALMDNYEWEKGYSERFGLYHVDFNNPSRPRTAKASAKYYAQIISQNGFPAVSS